VRLLQVLNTDVLDWSYYICVQSSGLPISSYRQKDCQNTEECCVCLEDFEDNVEMHTLPCGHYFHCHCIQQWFQGHNFCPLCKSVLKNCDEDTSSSSETLQQEDYDSAASDVGHPAAVHPSDEVPHARSTEFQFLNGAFEHLWPHII
jgi:hypothetical protein